MRCEYSRTIVYHNWMHYASSLVKCIITTLLTIIYHSITWVLSRCRVTTCAAVNVISAREPSRRARCRAWFNPGGGGSGSVSCRGGKVLWVGELWVDRKQE